MNNLLLVIVDALRADKTYGGPGKTAKTPNLDKLRQGSTTLAQAYSVASTTTPCFTSLLTGLYPPRHGVRSLYGYKLHPRLVTLPQALSQQGYQTRAEVTGPLLPLVGLSRGFHEYRYREKDATYDTGWGEELLDSIGRMREPWFLMVHLWELHSPTHIPEEFNSPRFGRNKYERALSGLDTYLGRLLEEVEGETAVAVTGDHGEEIAESRLHHLYLRTKYRVEKAVNPNKKDYLLKRMGHGHHIYEPLIHIPLIIKAPGIFPEGALMEGLVSQVDLAPTLAKICGIEFKPPYRLDGTPLNSNFEKPTQRSYVFAEATGRVIPDRAMWRAGVRTKRYKYVYQPYAREPGEELYDLGKDPKEKRNISKKRPELCKMLRYLVKSEYLSGRPVWREKAYLG